MKDFSNIKIRKITTSDGDSDFIVALRNDPVVKRGLFSSETVTRESHLKFLAKAKERGDMIFIVEKDGRPIGQVGIFQIDMKNKKVEGGSFILDPKIMGTGIGGFVEFNMLDYAFQILNVNKVHAEVLDTNKDVLHLHKNFGFKEEGRLREHVIMNGKKHDAYYLGLLKSEWDRERFIKLFGERKFNG